MTGLYFITRAMRKLGAIDPGRGPTGNEAQDGLDDLNQVLESWTRKRRLVWAEQITRVTFPSSKQSYTIGPGGDLATDINGAAILRPNRIRAGNIVLSTLNPPVHLPVTFLDSIEWLGIAVPLIATNIPVKAYYDQNFVSTPGTGGSSATAGLGTIYFNPYPAAPLPDFEFLARVKLTQFADLTTDYLFPDGYARAILYTLCEEMEHLAAPDVNLGRIRRMAARARADIANDNGMPPPRTGQDIGLGSQNDDRNADFDWATGQVR